MSDREILEKVYHKLTTQQWTDMTTDRAFDRWHDIIDLIEREWQRNDELLEQEVKDAYANSVDVSDIERHRGLVIGEDGTVKELK